MQVIKNLIKYFFLGIYTIIIYPFKCLILGFIYVFTPSKRDSLKYHDKPIVPLLILGLSLSIYFISIFFISRWYVQNLKINYLTETIIENTKVIEKIEEEEEKQDKQNSQGNSTNSDSNNTDTDNNTTNTNYTPSSQNDSATTSYLEVDFQSLLEQNADTVGWIKVNNTNINYSIVQTTDNEYYLKYDFNKKSNALGWVFADYRDNFTTFDSNTIIYAHNALNGTMFGTLSYCTKKYWYSNEKNLYIKMSTPKANIIWKIFSIYITTSDDVYYLKTYFSNNNEYQEFLDVLKGKSINNFNEELDSTDKILTLSTCTNNGKKRIVVHAKMFNIQYR